MLQDLVQDAGDRRLDLYLLALSELENGGVLQLDLLTTNHEIFHPQFLLQRESMPFHGLQDTPYLGLDRG
jgi:hypothetical protein